MTTAVVKAELAAHEAGIERTRGNFIECGTHLAAINDKTLYRAAGFTTFAAYWTARWAELFEFGSSRAYRLIQAAEVSGQIGQNISPALLPKTESQARALAPLVLGQGKARKNPNPEAAVKILTDLGATRITAAAIAARVAQVLQTKKRKVRPRKQQFVPTLRARVVLKWLTEMRTALVDDWVPRILASELSPEGDRHVAEKLRQFAKKVIALAETLERRSPPIGK